ncbi:MULTISPECIES: extracellular solute-binding protein [Gulbenkiania]|uniref:Putrescine-binding periplasmic protein n=2 Tax=Gulbenkiania TaxID=397456 RepID=A0A0K6GXN4_9NEIS|nr:MULTISPECIES: extracellular solute-binding protein [Gulbenkiania]TCW32932.1 spermidine/putrescine transport system substrate-binding protein [Gulbenkiania mobilis]CUA83379.1 Spermidine/putrescine-binding periplasmic protein [Gulbenkiania indica]
MKTAALLPRLVLSAALLAPFCAHAAGEVNLYNWSDYIPQPLLKRFEKETGIKVNLDVYESNESLLAKLKAGATGYDVVVPSDYMVKIMIDEKLLERIDAGKLSNFSRVMAPLDKPAFDPRREYSAPYMWGVTGFTYDSSRVPGGKLDESWKSFFEPPAALKGKVVALNDANELYNAASIYLKVDPCSEDPKVARQVQDLLLRQKPMLAMYNSDGTIERMQAREVIMHQQWNGAAYRTREKLKSAVFVYPREGIPFWNDNFVVPRGAKNRDNALKFINWMMEPRNIAEASNFTGYNNAIKGSDQFFKADLRADPAINPPAELRKRFVPNKVCSQKATQLRDRVWTNLKK